METYKVLIQSRFKSLSILVAGLSFSIISLMVRIKLNKSFFYLFLVWNVFLALIPYILTIYLSTIPKIGKLKLVFWLFVWLAFLPNAPYIITDFIHLRVSTAELIWLDILVLLSFSICGLILFYLSIFDMQRLVTSEFPKINFKIWKYPLFFLSSFGIYLGRFLRYNSWEIISNPKQLIFDIFEILLHPNLHVEAWFFTFGFGMFLIFGNWIFKEAIPSHPQNPEDR